MNHLLIMAMPITSVVSSQSDSYQDIVLNISNIDNDEGKIIIGHYASESTWLDSQEKGLVGKIEKGESTATFKNLPQGVYAISDFQHEDDNNDLDMNFMVIPKEDKRCSNNATGFFGPPKWKAAKFEVKDQDITQNIKL